MILIQNKLISLDVIEEKFVCDLTACKGACCWEGDAGAPLLESELAVLEAIWPEIKPFLTPAGIAAIETNGFWQRDERDGGFDTALIDGGPCAYIAYGPDGTASCGIEKAWLAGATAFRKPISCHLYPIRAHRNEATGFEALNFHHWEICSAACENGKKLRVPAHRFLKEAIERAYGADFYEELDGVAEALLENRRVE